MWFSGTWTNYEYYGGTWNQTGTGAYSARKSYVARYRRQLAIAESEDFNPTGGAFNYHSTPTFPATSVLFDLQRNDVFSVTGRNYKPALQSVCKSPSFPPHPLCIPILKQPCFPDR